VARGGHHLQAVGMDEEPQWYYCLRHGTVERGQVCPAKDRLGPYPSADEAAHALDRVHERNKEWESQDRD
jgi:hypothetical protein